MTDSRRALPLICSVTSSRLPISALYFPQLEHYGVGPHWLTSTCHLVLVPGGYVAPEPHVRSDSRGERLEPEHGSLRGVCVPGPADAHVHGVHCASGQARWPPRDDPVPGAQLESVHSIPTSTGSPALIPSWSGLSLPSDLQTALAERLGVTILQRPWIRSVTLHFLTFHDLFPKHVPTF